MKLFYEATTLFLPSSNELRNSPSYRADAIERSSITLGLKADQWLVVASEAYKKGNTEVGDIAGNRGLKLLAEIDRLMESHPFNRLDLWLAFARSNSKDTTLQNYYESNARQIITVLGPPVDDYSCLIWSGLIRDFYFERMVKVLESLKTGKKLDQNKFKLEWISKSGVSDYTPYDNTVETARELAENALSEELPPINH